MRGSGREWLQTLASLLYDFGGLLLGLEKSLDTLRLLCSLYTRQIDGGEELRRSISPYSTSFVLSPRKI